MKDPIDANQLLTVCSQICETQQRLELSIKWAKLRLTTIDYLDEEEDSAAVKCFDSLIVLSNLSQLMAQQLDELQLKLNNSSGKQSTIHDQIASQQLMYFTSEWYENIRPKLEETFELASGFGFSEDKASGRKLSYSTSGGSRTNEQVREALMRLRESMGENERLIGVIASNIDLTKNTIETIYRSLQVTKSDLANAHKNTELALKYLREINWWRVLGYFLIVALVLIVAYYLFTVFLELD